MGEARLASNIAKLPALLKTTGEEIMSEAQAIAYTANFACLEKNGALRPGQLQTALRGTIGHPKAERNRLDYVLLADLLKQLEATLNSGSAPQLRAEGRRDD
jgi:hypothetical protein